MRAYVFAFVDLGSPLLFPFLAELSSQQTFTRQ